MLKWKIYVCRAQINFENWYTVPLSYINLALKFCHFALFTLILSNIDIAQNVWFRMLWLVGKTLKRLSRVPRLRISVGPQLFSPGAHRSVLGWRFPKDWSSQYFPRVDAYASKPCLGPQTKYFRPRAGLWAILTVGYYGPRLQSAARAVLGGPESLYRGPK